MLRSDRYNSPVSLLLLCQWQQNAEWMQWSESLTVQQYWCIQQKELMPNTGQMNLCREGLIIQIHKLQKIGHLLILKLACKICLEWMTGLMTRVTPPWNQRISQREKQGTHCESSNKTISWNWVLIWYASGNRRGFGNLMFPLWFTLIRGSFVFLDMGPFNLFLVSPPLFWGALVDLWLATFQQIFDFWGYWLWILRIALRSARGLSCFKYPPTLIWMVGPMSTSSLGYGAFTLDVKSMLNKNLGGILGDIHC